ncbi:MAG: serine/threonine protein phosphatase [Magnetospirillum sp. WYHS-4]
MVGTQLAPPLPPRISPGRRVYAVGDIHGRADLLRRLLDRIAADAGDSPDLRHVLVFLGDYVDRGPESAKVIDLLLEGPPSGFDIVYLRGNHEQFLVDFLDLGVAGETWLANGGRATIESYGLDATAVLFGRTSLADLRESLRDALPASHRAFLDALKLYHEESGYLFVHAGIRPGATLADQVPADLLWIRGPFLMSTQDFGRVVVHGHTVEPEPAILRNRIGIDTGAYRSGRLTCLVLEGEIRRVLSTL